MLIRKILYRFPFLLIKLRTEFDIQATMTTIDYSILKLDQAN